MSVESRRNADAEASGPTQSFSRQAHERTLAQHVEAGELHLAAAAFQEEHAAAELALGRPEGAARMQERARKERERARAEQERAARARQHLGS